MHWKEIALAGALLMPLASFGSKAAETVGCEGAYASLPQGAILDLLDPEAPSERRDAAHGDALTVGVERDHVIANDFALAGATVFERRLHAEIEFVQAHRHGEVFTNHAPARVGDACKHARAQRQRRLRLFRQSER